MLHMYLTAFKIFGQSCPFITDKRLMFPVFQLMLHNYTLAHSFYPCDVFSYVSKLIKIFGISPYIILFSPAVLQDDIFTRRTYFTAL